MSHGYPRLLGDVGGTNARWAWQPKAGVPPQDVLVTPCATSASLYDSVANYLTVHDLPPPRYAGIGIATAIGGDRVHMTNNTWSFSISEFKKALGLEHCLVINDFTALALSLPALGASDLRAIGTEGAALTGAPMALLGPGTGLGVSGLLPTDSGEWAALSGEGGHVTLAAANDYEAALLAFMRSRFGHVSAERVLSGPGLVNLYQAICDLNGQLAQELRPADVTSAAIAGTDRACVQTVGLFAGFLGAVAGNLALTLGSRGGVYIGGGIVPQLGGAFDSGAFRQRFEDKGRFADYLRAIPTWLITAPTPALLGVARALDALKSP